MLQFLRFRKSYGAATVLTAVDLKIPAGIFWVKGVNGSGKSTLLRAAAGIIDFEGDILLDAISLKKNPVDFRRRVNFAEAEPLFPEFLTGSEMIRLFISAKGGPAEQANFFIDSMKMAGWVDDPIGTYSSGMLKKLSLVLAFMGEPKIILLDEPLITIDAASLEVLYQWILQKHLNAGVTFLLSSHQPLALPGFADRGWIEVANNHVDLGQL